MLGPKRAARGGLANECPSLAERPRRRHERDSRGVRKLVDTGVQRFGLIALMINNAGLIQQSPHEL